MSESFSSRIVNEVGSWEGVTYAPHRYGGIEFRPGTARRLLLAGDETALPAICAILPAQDLLGLGSAARFNTPGNPQGNWTWRLTDAEFAELARVLPSWRPRLARCRRLSA